MHNLAWKLALVIEGVARPPLLDTYERERQGVGRWNADRSLENAYMVARINAAADGSGLNGEAPDAAVAASTRYGNFHGMELGYVYESDAVIPDGTAPPAVEDPVIDYAPCARPGHRAPHVWLRRSETKVSTLDLFGPASRC